MQRPKIKMKEFSTAKERSFKGNANKLMKENYNSKREDNKEEDQQEDERNVIL